MKRVITILAVFLVGFTVACAMYRECNTLDCAASGRTHTLCVGIESFGRSECH